jgi:hypothetical protein
MKEIDERIKRAKYEIQREYPPVQYDSEIQRIYEETSKQGSVRRFAVEKPVVKDSSYLQEEDINLYMDAAKAPRSIKAGAEGSIRSLKGLTYSKTSEKGKFLVASDPRLAKTETPKISAVTPPSLSYPVEDIPDNISVSSRKSKRVLFGKRPASRSGKQDSEYSMSERGDDDYRSPGQDMNLWETPKQSDDMSDLESQADTMNVGTRLPSGTPQHGT